MGRLVLRVIAIGSVLGLAACAQAPETNAPADIAAVGALRTSFVTAFNAGDATGVGSTYTSDATSNENHQPTAIGRDAIVAAHKELFTQMAATIELTPDETKTMGDVGWDRGRWKITLTPKAGGPAMSDEGHYLVLLAKGSDGTWKVTNDIDNSSMPLPPPPMPPAGKGK